VVVEIFVAQGQAVDALRHQFPDSVLDSLGVAVVGKTGRQLPECPGQAFGLAQQQAAAVGGDRAAIKTADHGALAQGLKNEVGAVTRCSHKAVSPAWHRGC
jgi:hypothetical protein